MIYMFYMVKKGRVGRWNGLIRFSMEDRRSRRFGVRPAKELTMKNR